PPRPRRAGHRMGHRLPAEAGRAPLPAERRAHRGRRRASAGRVKEFRLPDIGEGLTEAEIVKWHVPVGGVVAMDETIVEIETDKAVVEIPSPFAGRVVHHGAGEGDTVRVGEVLVVIADDNESWAAPSVSAARGPEV